MFAAVRGIRAGDEETPLLLVPASMSPSVRRSELKEQPHASVSITNISFAGNTATGGKGQTVEQRWLCEFAHERLGRQL